MLTLCIDRDGIGHILPFEEGLAGFGHNYWSRSVGFESVEQAVADGKLAPNPCRICGSPYMLSYGDGLNERLLAEQMCHGCNFWNSQLAQAGGLRINGSHYRLGNESGPAKWRGFAGRRYRIRRFGELEPIETTDLWCQGLIPPHWRAALPDNAEFVHD